MNAIARHILTGTEMLSKPRLLPHILKKVHSITRKLSPHSPWSSASCETGLGLATLARTRAWSTASSKFLESSARVWAAANICRWHSSLSEVMAFCWASRILLISSPKSLFSSFLVPSIWDGEERRLRDTVYRCRGRQILTDGRWWVVVLHLVAIKRKNEEEEEDDTVTTTIVWLLAGRWWKPDPKKSTH